MGFRYRFCPLGRGALIKAHVVSKSQLLKPSIAVRAYITLNVTCEAVGGKLDHALGGVHLGSTSGTQTLEHPPPVSPLVTARRPVSEAVAAAGMLTHAGVCWRVLTYEVC